MEMNKLNTYWNKVRKDLSNLNVQSNLVNPALLLSGNLLFGQNFLTPKLFKIPIHLSFRKNTM